MLPMLNKHDYKAADAKVYHPPRELSQDKPRREHLHESSRNSAKGKYPHFYEELEEGSSSPITTKTPPRATPCALMTTLRTKVKL